MFNWWPLTGRPDFCDTKQCSDEFLATKLQAYGTKDALVARTRPKSNGYNLSMGEVEVMSLEAGCLGMQLRSE